jgi:hypothetical protein
MISTTPEPPIWTPGDFSADTGRAAQIRSLCARSRPDLPDVSEFRICMLMQRSASSVAIGNAVKVRSSTLIPAL